MKNQRRFYHLSLCRTLFGEWALTREWGRIGTQGGRNLVEYFQTFEESQIALQQMKLTRERRGYCAIPVQLTLPFRRR